MLKRFLIFTGYKDQCQSGWDSLHGDYDTAKEATDKAKELTGHCDAWDDPDYDGDYDENDDVDGTMWCQVVDTDTKEVIKEYGYEVP